jgi:hypothetical protein
MVVVFIVLFCPCLYSKFMSWMAHGKRPPRRLSYKHNATKAAQQPEEPKEPIPLEEDPAYATRNDMEEIFVVPIVNDLETTPDSNLPSCSEQRHNSWIKTAYVDISRACAPRSECGCSSVVLAAPFLIAVNVVMLKLNPPKNEVSQRRSWNVELISHYYPRPHPNRINKGRTTTSGWLGFSLENQN